MRKELQLKLLGYEDAHAYHVMRIFKRHDEAGLQKLYEVRGDEHAYSLRARQYQEDLKKVLQDDSEEAEAHIRAAWKHLQGAEGKDDAQS